MQDVSHGPFSSIITPQSAGDGHEMPSGMTGALRVYGAPAAVRRLLERVRDAGVLRCSDHFHSVHGASDAELRRLAGPLGRLDVDDVRWDVIGAAYSGKRHRI